MTGPDPPLHMPAWQDKLSARQIHAIMGYFISLATDRDHEVGADILGNDI